METKVIIDIAETALFGAMQQVIQHYFPWGLVFRRELPRVVAYVIGTLAYLVPLTVLFHCWAMNNQMYLFGYLIALWACVVASGVAVVFVRALDWALDRITRSIESDERDAKND